MQKKTGRRVICKYLRGDFMKKTILAFVLTITVFLCVFVENAYGQNTAPIDLILVLDTSTAMSSSYENVNNYLSAEFLSEFLRAGDTFHLITFAGNPRLDSARRILGTGDVETIIGRMMIQYPVETGNNVSSALSYAEQYVTSLPNRSKKIVLVTIGNQASSGLVTAARQRLSSSNTTIDYVQVTPGQRLTNLPTSGRAAARTTTASQPAAQRQTPPTTSTATTQPPATSTTPPTASTATTTPPPAASTTTPPPATTTTTTTPSAASTTTTAQRQTPSATSTTPATQSATTTTPPPAASTTPTTQPATTTTPPPAVSTTTTTTLPAASNSNTTTTTPASTVTTPPAASTTSPASSTPPAASSLVTTSTPNAAATLPVASESTGIAAGVDDVEASALLSNEEAALSDAEDDIKAEDETEAEVSSLESSEIVASDKTELTASDKQETASSSQMTAAKAPQKKKSQPAKSFTSSLPFIIGIIILILLILGLIIFLLSRKLNSSPNRVMTSSSPPKEEASADSREDLANFAAGQQRQRTTPYDDRITKDDVKVSVINPSGPLLLNLFVNDQNTSIGKRNIHSLKSGYSLTVGGGKADDYFIFLVPVPAKLGEIRRDGSQLTFIPHKAKYFPDIGSNQVKDCINKTIRIISDKNYEMRFRFEMYEDPLIALNRLLHSLKVPG